MLKSLRLSPDEGTATPAPAAKIIPAPGAENAPPPPPTVPVSKAEYDKLILDANRAKELEAKTAELERNWQHAQRLLRPDTSPEAAQESLRVMMAQSGYSQDQIEKYIQETYSETPEPETRQPSRRKDDGGEGVDPRVVRMQQDMEAMRAEMNSNRAQGLQSMLDQSVKLALDQTPELGTLLEVVAGFSVDAEGEQATADLGQAKATLTDEIRRETLDRLRERRARESRAHGREVWDDRWIHEESKAAAKSAHAKFRQFVPDPSRIGRAPETDPWAAALKNDKKPLSAPEYKPGMSFEDARAQTKDWAVDTLLRAAAESSTGSNRT